MTKGYIILARKIADSEIFHKPATWFKIFVYLVMKASHKDRGYLKRGQCFISYETICRECRTSNSVVDHAIRYMKKARMLATRKATGGMIVTVVNYHTYQDPTCYASDSKSETKATDPPVCGETKAIQKRQHITSIKTLKHYNKNERGRFTPPTLQEIQQLIQERGYPVDPDRFMNFYASKGWMVGKNKMKDWPAALAGWQSRGSKPEQTSADKLAEYEKQTQGMLTGITPNG